MANTNKQQILTLHTTQGDKYNAATEQQENTCDQNRHYGQNNGDFFLIDLCGHYQHRNPSILELAF